MSDDYTKLPRLFVDYALEKNRPVPLSPAQAHYFRNVIRRKEGDVLRLFNGRDGEWLARLQELGKKNGAILPEKQLCPQPQQERAIHLIFAPIKKARLDFLIEKAVELGVTHLHPALTQNAEARQINDSRIRQQIIEAAEQCERLDIPSFTKLQPLESLLTGWNSAIPVYACIERQSAPLLTASAAPGKQAAILVGPEGGFTEDEKALLTDSGFIKTVSLGPRILRAETACLKALSIIGQNA